MKDVAARPSPPDGAAYPSEPCGLRWLYSSRQCDARHFASSRSAKISAFSSSSRRRPLKLSP
jgi:hypothetical protein